jgi:phosphotransferase system  glucose/maltose/N-acetylglucosamine-specific IIC component
MIGGGVNLMATLDLGNVIMAAVTALLALLVTIAMEKQNAIVAFLNVIVAA